MVWIIAGVLIIVFLIFLSAFFSSSEMAFISINRAIVVDKARKGDRKAKILENLLKNPDNVISAIVIGNNLVNISASILAGAIVTEIFGNIGIGIATLIMFLLVIVFCEATPKALGIKNEKLALKVARSLHIITKLFHPLVVTLNYISKGLLSIMGGNNKRDAAVTEHEIMAMMRLGVEEGTIEKDEREMVNDVFEFDETVADEVDRPKHKIEFIHENDTVEKLIMKSVRTGYSRFPVYRNNFDDVIGMIHVKDSLILNDKSLPVKKIMRKILKVAPDMKADDVLREMKRTKTHLALLQHRNGKTVGLVSMEDIIEEIFGEISDEHDAKPLV
ncbi:MAG: HlyC/CorC family transporter [Thermoplasmatales archaeon]|nr:HlyC/CorC family transporter [Thermoplasmatales archaeon]